MYVNFTQILFIDLQYRLICIVWLTSDVFMWKLFLSEDTPVASKRVEDITKNNTHDVLLDGLFTPLFLSRLFCRISSGVCTDLWSMRLYLRVNNLHFLSRWIGRDLLPNFPTFWHSSWSCLQINEPRNQVYKET
jgi:hypothetical protein